jgi:hypothetical protein
LGFGGGVSSALVTTDRDIAQALTTFLEDRRVLFNPEWLEESSQVDHSVQEIRKELTEALQQLDPKSPAGDPMRAMRAACRRYLDEPRQKFRHVGEGSYRRGHELDPGFFVALGELRAVFGAELQRLDGLFHLTIETQLRNVFPAQDQP